MSADIALLSDPNPEANEALVKLLAGMAFLTFAAPTAAALDHELAKGLIVTAASLLVVADVMLAKACVPTLERCSTERARLRLPRPALALIYDAGSLSTISRPSLVGCDTLIIVERPVPVAELRAAALECRLTARRFDVETPRR
jgi:hypothetical protein